MSILVVSWLNLFEVLGFGLSARLSSFKMEDWERKKESVLQQLNLLNCEELGALCGTLKITIPATKLGKRSLTFNLVSRYINSEEIEDSDDQGLAIFTGIDDQLKEMISKRMKDEKPLEFKQQQGVATVEVVEHGSGDSSRTNYNANSISSSTSHLPVQDVANPIGNAGGGVLSNSSVNDGVVASATRENGGSATIAVNNSTSGGDRSVRVKLTKLQEFKIHGGFVATGDNPISYSNLKYQMEEGEAHGYEPKEIMAGVIRAIKPNSKLRKFLESSGLMPIEDFLRHIKNHYDLEDSDSVLTKLSETLQGANQEVKEYLAEMMDIRNNVMTLSREEGFPLPVDMVRRRFLKAVALGLTEDSVRLEFQAFLNKVEDEKRVVTDLELSDKIKLIDARNKEHKKKMGNKVGTNAVSVASKQDGAVMAALSKISARVEELAVTRNDSVAAAGSRILTEQFSRWLCFDLSPLPKTFSHFQKKSTRVYSDSLFS